MIRYNTIKYVKKKYDLFWRYKDAKNFKYIKAARKAKIEIRRRLEKLAKNIKTDNKSFYAHARSRNETKVTIGPILNESGMS